MKLLNVPIQKFFIKYARSLIDVFMAHKEEKKNPKEMYFFKKIKHHMDNKAKPGIKSWLVKWQG